MKELKMTTKRDKPLFITLLGFFFLLFVVPFTVVISQQQQTIKQRAAMVSPTPTPPPYFFNGLNVFVGYADTYRPNPNVPTPWNGSSNTHYIGTNDPHHIDSAAIRFENTSSIPVSIQSVVVTLPNHVPIPHATVTQKPFNLWGSFIVAPHTSTIITETNSQNFDTSDLVIPGIACKGQAGPGNNPPHVAIKLADGSTTTLLDTGHVLDSGGGDPGICKSNESHQWSAIGTIGGAEAHLTLAPADSTYPIGSNASLQAIATLKDTSNTLPLSNVDVTFSVVSGPNTGKTGSATTDASGNATFSYTSQKLGTDLLKATVTNISGGSFDSNNVTVHWVQPTPTPTPTPLLTTISLTVFEHGIGNSGDNTNPNDFSLSNKNPIHNQISVNILLYNLQNQLVASSDGMLTYEPTTGSFKSGLNFIGGNFLETGKYSISIKTNYHLRKLLPSIQTITAGQNNQVPPITLVAGDIDNDNVLDVEDYNILLNCYSDLIAANLCTDPKLKIAADLNDDGLVNQIDYSLFIRELTTQPGI